MSEDAHTLDIAPTTTVPAALFIPKPEPKPRARAEQCLSMRGWLLFFGDECIDITTSAFVAETFVDAMNFHPNPFDVHPKGRFA